MHVVKFGIEKYVVGRDRTNDHFLSNLDFKKVEGLLFHIFDTERQGWKTRKNLVK